MGGAQAGYNIQRGHVVFGLEGDIGYLGISAKSSGSYTPSSNPGNFHCGTYWAGDGHVCDISGQYSTSGGLYGDITGRLGYATDRVLFYGKGGVAFLNADTKANYKGESVGWINTEFLFQFRQQRDACRLDHRSGAEYALNPAWSLKAEYQHFDFGSMSYNYSEHLYLSERLRGGLHSPSYRRQERQSRLPPTAVKVGCELSHQ